MDNLDDVYPYERDPDSHEYAWVFFNAAGVRHDLETCNALARFVFDELGCGAPGSSGPPRLKYDAVGGSGAPWEPGRWIPVDHDRMVVTATAPAVDVTAMSEAEVAEWQAAIDARRDALRAGAANGHRDETGEG